MPASRRVRLAVLGVSHTYGGRVPTHALDGVSAEVFDNEFLAILGPVGCGKTTLLRIVAGLLRPTEGRVLCDGRPVSGPGPDRGYVFQEEAIFPWMTVRENLELGLLARGDEAATRQAIVDGLLELTGLGAYARAYPKELSGGMTKMVEVARVLATDPSILLLDEPFGLLDAQTRSRMQAELHRLWEHRRKTVVLVTHDIEEAIFLAVTERPGRIKARVEITLPRPRAAEMRFSAEFWALKRRIWEALSGPGKAPGSAAEPGVPSRRPEWIA